MPIARLFHRHGIPTQTPPSLFSRFLLHLSLSPADKAVSVLNVVEANPFRHLNHLALKFVPASDAYLKKYLAECLLSFKVLTHEFSQIS